MAAVDNAIDNISEARATAGALISRFEFRGQQIATSLENIDAAKSSIMDVDLAAEQSKLVSNQVLVQAAVSAVSQANQIPQSLLRSEEHTSELQSLMRISYAVFCLTKKRTTTINLPGNK